MKSEELLQVMISCEYWEVLKAIKGYAEHNLQSLYIDLERPEEYSDAL